jgi:hypothetical protein
MVFVESLKRSGLALAVAAVLGLPSASHAQHWRGGGIGPGAAVGIGLGSFALGTAVGSAAARPYGYYPYGYYAPPPAYYAPPPVYPYRTCWYAQFNGYFAC